MLTPEAILGTLLGLGLAAKLLYRVRRKQAEAEAEQRSARPLDRDRHRVSWQDWAAADDDDDDSWEEVETLRV